jgi:hypothetical protein
MHSSSVHLLLTLLCLGTLDALAQSTTIVVTTGQASFTPDLTRGEVRQKALDDAFSKAITEVVGLDIQSETYGSKSETSGQSSEEGAFFEVFSVVNRSVAYGRVVRHKVLDERIEQQPLASGGTADIVRVTVECEVAKDLDRPDPAFRLTLRTEKEVFYDRGALRENDEIVVALRCSQEAYVTLFGVAKDTVSVLFPNQIAKENRLKASEELVFPSAEMRLLGLHLRVSVPPGERRSSEMIFAIATKDPMQFAPAHATSDGNVVPTYNAALDDLQRWLSQIPPSRRTEACQMYEVRRK